MTEQCTDDDLVVPTLLRVETVADIEKQLDEINATIAQLEKDSIANKRQEIHIAAQLGQADKDKLKIKRRLANAPWDAA